MCTPLLGAGYLIGYLRRKGVKCSYIDAIKTRQTIEEIAVICKDDKPDLIAITIMTLFYDNAKSLINRLSPLGIPVVVGGSHVSALPVETLRDTKADYAIYGEGEEVLFELVKFLEGGGRKDRTNKIDIKGLVYRDYKGNIIRNQPAPLIEDLNGLPFPAWDLMDPRTYPFAPHGSIAKEYPIAPVLTSRGCPFNCDYCSVNVVWRNRYRMRSVKNVVDEIEFLIKNYGVKEIHFEDDNLTITKKRITDICHEITRRKLKFIWSCPNGVRVDSLDKETLNIMKKAGCYSLSFGIESGLQEMLNNVNKKLDLSVAKGVVDITKKLGIETRAFFILGLPEETMKTARKTIDFALSLNLDLAGFFTFVPMPGSNIFNKWVRKNDIDVMKIDWSRMNKSGGKNSISICELSPKQLSTLQKGAYRNFYLRPHIVFRMIMKIRPIQLKWLMKRFFSMVKSK